MQSISHGIVGSIGFAITCDLLLKSGYFFPAPWDQQKSGKSSGIKQLSGKLIEWIAMQYSREQFDINAYFLGFFGCTFANRNLTYVLCYYYSISYLFLQRKNFRFLYYELFYLCTFFSKVSIFSKLCRNNLLFMNVAVSALQNASLCP